MARVFSPRGLQSVSKLYQAQIRRQSFYQIVTSLQRLHMNYFGILVFIFSIDFVHRVKAVLSSASDLPFFSKLYRAQILKERSYQTVYMTLQRHRVTSHVTLKGHSLKHFIYETTCLIGLKPRMCLYKGKHYK